MKKSFSLSIIALVAVMFLGIKSYQSSIINLCFVGDILLDRGVRNKLVLQGFDYPYENVKGILKKADIAFGNLECPLTDGGTPVLKRRDLIFKGDIGNAKSLKRTGFDILNLANNHSVDYGRKGVVSTIQVLNGLDIHTLGVGPDRKDAHKPVFMETNNSLTGFIGCTVFPPEGYINLDNRPDVARVDYENIGNEIREAKKKCDFLVVSFHWGREYEFFPSEAQEHLAHTAVDSGADLVVGHHPHVLQGVERYKDSLIFYSLGNFVFDRQIQKGTDETIILQLKIKDGQWEEAEIIPVKIINCQPNIVRGSEADYILNRLKLYSEGMNTSISIKNRIGYIKNR